MLLTGVSIVWISAVGWIWIQILAPKPAPEPAEKSLTLLQKVTTAEDRKALFNTDKVEDLATEGAKAAIDKFKSTWKFRSSNQKPRRMPRFRRMLQRSKGVNDVRDRPSVTLAFHPVSAIRP